MNRYKANLRVQVPVQAKYFVQSSNKKCLKTNLGYLFAIEGVHVDWIQIF